jgi:predicted outer membrane repeat protein
VWGKRAEEKKAMKNPRRSFPGGAARRPRLHGAHVPSRIHGGRVLRCESLEARRLLAVVTVDTELDVVDFNDGKTSLREAVFATNTVPGPDEIRFDFGHDGPATILLNQGELAITDSLSITGPGAELLTIDAQRKSTIFRIFNGGIDVSIERMSLTHGQSGASGGAIFARVHSLQLRNVRVTDSTAATYGGAIFMASGELRIEHGEITGNQAPNAGGGIYTRGAVTILNSRISSNTGSWGGGILVHGGTHLIIEASEITENVANLIGWGGGVYADAAQVRIDATTVARNFARRLGGGVYAHGSQISISDSRISNNVAGVRGSGPANGGGLHVGAYVSAEIQRSDFSENVALNGAAVFLEGGTLHINQSEITNNHAQSHGGGIYVSVGRLILTASTVNLNAAGDSVHQNGRGGGIWFQYSNDSTINSSTISDNFASRLGGGVAGESANITFANTTISGNTARSAGGLHGASYALLNATLTNNAATTPGEVGGISALHVHLDHTILAGNHDVSGAASDIKSNDVKSRFSLIGDRRGSNITDESPIDSPDANGNLIGGPVHGAIDPKLGPLADNGGPTLTHLPMPGSPVIDAGDLALEPGVGDTPLFDQRGAPFSRVVGALIDIGAFEVQVVGGTFTADLNGDGRGDGADFLLWQRQLGGGVVELTRGPRPPVRAYFETQLALREAPTAVLALGAFNSTKAKSPEPREPAIFAPPSESRPVYSASRRTGFAISDAPIRQSEGDARDLAFDEFEPVELDFELSAWP